MSGNNGKIMEKPTRSINMVRNTTPRPVLAFDDVTLLV
jgi:hypothetical protein